MRIFDDIYNWIAKRNIGELFGLRWEPDRDLRYQQKRLASRARDWKEYLEKTEHHISEGNPEKAGDAAYQALHEVPHPVLPEVVRLHDKINEIIARMPSGYEPPSYHPAPPKPRMPASEARSRLIEAIDHFENGNLNEAQDILTKISRHKLFSHEGVKAIDIKYEVGAFGARMMDFRRSAGQESSDE